MLKLEIRSVAEANVAIAVLHTYVSSMSNDKVAKHVEKRAMCNEKPVKEVKHEKPVKEVDEKPVKQVDEKPGMRDEKPVKQVDEKPGMRDEKRVKEVKHEKSGMRDEKRVKEVKHEKSVKEVDGDSVDLITIKKACRQLAKVTDSHNVRLVISNITGSKILADTPKSDYDKLYNALIKACDVTKPETKAVTTKSEPLTDNDDGLDKIRRLCNKIVVGDGTYSPETKKANRVKVKAIIGKYSPILSDVNVEDYTSLIADLEAL